MVTELLTRPEAAAMLKLEVQTLASWRTRGVGPPMVKVGGSIRYRLSDVERWLASRTITPGEVLAGAGR